MQPLYEEFTAQRMCAFGWGRKPSGGGAGHVHHYMDMRKRVPGPVYVAIARDPAMGNAPRGFQLHFRSLCPVPSAASSQPSLPLLLRLLLLTSP